MCHHNAARSSALKPGKPLCLAVIGQTPLIVLPGFPTSAIFTFHEFVAPVLRRLAGRTEDPADTVPARLPLRVNSERGRTEYLLVNLVAAGEGSGPYVAYPLGKGSGSVTACGVRDRVTSVSTCPVCGNMSNGCTTPSA